MWNTNRSVQNSNSGRRVHFLQRYPLKHERQSTGNIKPSSRCIYYLIDSIESEKYKRIGQPGMSYRIWPRDQFESLVFIVHSRSCDQTIQGFIKFEILSVSPDELRCTFEWKMACSYFSLFEKGPHVKCSQVICKEKMFLVRKLIKKRAHKTYLISILPNV